LLIGSAAQRNGNNGFFCGNSVSIADVEMFDMFVNWICPSGAFDKIKEKPALLKCLKNFASIPSVREYIHSDKFPKTTGPSFPSFHIANVVEKCVVPHELFQ